MITASIRTPPENEVTVTMPESVAKRLASLLYLVPSVDEEEPLDRLYATLRAAGVGTEVFFEDYPYRVIPR